MSNIIVNKVSKNTYPKMWLGVLLVVLASLLTAMASLFWKLADAELNFYLFLGYVLQGVASLFLVFSFKYGKLSILHPMLSLSYVFALFLSFFVLNENIISLQLIGVFLILFGVLLLSKGVEK